MPTVPTPRKGRFWRGTAAAVAVIGLLWLIAANAAGGIDPQHGAAFPLLAISVPAALAMCLTGVALCAVTRQWRLTAAATIVTAIAWPWSTVPLNITGNNAPNGSDTLTLLTFNVRGFEPLKASQPEKVSSSLKFILDTDADIVVVQEASPSFLSFDKYPYTKPLIARLDSMYPYRCHEYHDMVMMSKFPYEVRSDSTRLYAFRAPDNCLVHYSYPIRIFEVTLPGNELMIAATHLQSFGLTMRIDNSRAMKGYDDGRSTRSHLTKAFIQRAEEARTLRNWLDKCLAANVVVMGDFNDVPGSFAWRTIMGSDMRDAFSEAGLGYQHSFRLKNMFVRIDHVLYRGGLTPLSSSTPHAGQSDHYPVVTKFAIKKK